jgi:hypothetical protein
MAMGQNFYTAIITGILTILICLSVSAQDEALKLNQETKFTLKNKEQKVLTLNLKKGDYTEVHWQDTLATFSSFPIIAPSGKNIAETIYYENSFPFVAKEDGQYKLVFDGEGIEDNKVTEVAVDYTNVFKLPKSAKLKKQKKVNGYEVRIYNAADNKAEGYGTYLLIQKDGKLLDVLKGGSLVGEGFTFAEDSLENDSPGGRKSADLFRTTLDKTGDGTSDIAVQFYTGGAHCCFDMHFYELGKDGVRKIKTINGMDSDIMAIGKKPNGSLILRTGDSTFGYWLTSFAGSPIPSVILTFQNGEFRPDAKLMKRNAPSLAVLKQKAAKAKKNMDLTPYTGGDTDGFLDAFWGEMLDLMYAGNETAAWQYFDLVWDKRKPGKEKFKQDFLERLNDSLYWQMMQEN